MDYYQAPARDVVPRVAIMDRISDVLMPATQAAQASPEHRAAWESAKSYVQRRGHETRSYNVLATQYGNVSGTAEHEVNAKTGMVTVRFVGFDERIRRNRIYNERTVPWWRMPCKTLQDMKQAWETEDDPNSWR